MIARTIHRSQIRPSPKPRLLKFNLLKFNRTAAGWIAAAAAARLFPACSA